MEMNYRLITKIFLAVTAVLVIVFDIIVYAKGGGIATISDVVMMWAKKISFLPLAYGVLTGHFFLPTKTGSTPKTFLIAFLIVLFIGTAGTVYHLIPFKDAHLDIAFSPICMVVCGAIIGSILWPMNDREEK
jgi:hypothetical protein